MGGGAWTAAGAAAALAVFAIWIYNRLIAQRNLAREGFADIDVQLKRRADLVPRLVEAVRGYAAHEKALRMACLYFHSLFPGRFFAGTVPDLP
jgi:LemA protein